jgi:hypothetical protein
MPAVPQVPRPGIPALNNAAAFAVPAFAPPAAPQLPPAPARQAPPPAAAPEAAQPQTAPAKSNLPLIIALNLVAIAAIAVIIYFMMKH